MSQLWPSWHTFVNCIRSLWVIPVFESSIFLIMLVSSLSTGILIHPSPPNLSLLFFFSNGVLFSRDRCFRRSLASVTASCSRMRGPLRPWTTSRPCPSLFPTLPLQALVIFGDTSTTSTTKVNSSVVCVFFPLQHSRESSNLNFNEFFSFQSKRCPEYSSKLQTMK